MAAHAYKLNQGLNEETQLERTGLAPEFEFQGPRAVPGSSRRVQKKEIP